MFTFLKRALLVSAASIVASSSAFALEPGPYVGLGAGLHMPESSSAIARLSPNATATPFKTSFDNGLIGIATAGFKWDQGFRAEIEGGYRQADIRKINGIAANGVQKVMSLSANLLYDFDINSFFTPYLGAGLGISLNKWHRVSVTASPAFDDRKSALQFQGIAGVSMPVTDRLDAFVGYQYIGSEKVRFAGRPTGARALGHGDRSHNILVGLRYALNATPKPAPVVEAPRASMPPPPPPPPPVVAPPSPPAVPAKFLVFFDFDKANLRADAQKIVDEAADYAKKNGKAVISTTGHADTSGSPAYNLALSERRAKAVMAALLGRGFTAKDVIVRFKGESEPLVATADGVREPQNRRVEIIFE